MLRRAIGIHVERVSAQVLSVFLVTGNWKGFLPHESLRTPGTITFQS